MAADSARRDEVLKALAKVQDPDLHRDIVSLGFIKNLEINGSKVSLDIELTTPACPVKDLMKKQAEDSINSLGWPSELAITMTAQVRAAPNLGDAVQVKNIIAVASGKGGVGKSTVAVNLAYSLAKSGASVGILDADIYGPSVPHMLGRQKDRPSTVTVDGKQRILAIEHQGVKLMSMGFLVEADKPVIWRGPMLHGTLQQFFSDVDWGPLDYLVIDLPPGTGDIQLTLTQKIQVSGAVIVSTPQDVAMIDARKALNMFRQVNVPVLGIIENMSGFNCSSCGHHEAIFGEGGAKDWAAREGIKFLG
ncbi:MAG: Mrp/NBP35 family ATP-binding protein, partial [Planctomycetes bacterium]|nr:Mrp/NBP35 family ATP-binding protein [Planctomycetota bacterium]